MTIESILKKLNQHENLTADEMQFVMQAIMTNSLSPIQIADFLIALKTKGETATEIISAVKVLLALADKITIKHNNLIDIVGTGGDGANIFNISTLSTFVVAAAGGIVAKHGNRSVSSKSGSADVLEQAGCNLKLTAKQIALCVENVGIGFLFAPQFHPAMSHVASIRKQLGVRTIFNLLGPLINPAATTQQLIGVYGKQWLLPFAEVLQALGKKHVLLVHSEDGLDEISLAQSTQVVEIKNNTLHEFTIAPENFAIPRQDLTPLIVNNAIESLAYFQRVLNNEPGPWLDIVLLNAGAAIYVADLAESIAAGIKQARAVIAAGLAQAKFNEYIAYTNRF